jgi:hypothetical protein
MCSDLLGTALRRDVLRSYELSSTALAGKTEQVLSHDPYRAAGAFLPRSMGCGVHDDLANDSPAIVVRIAARHQKSSECLGNPHRLWLGRVTVEVTQRRAHAAPAVDRPRELSRGSPALMC